MVIFPLGENLFVAGENMSKRQKKKKENHRQEGCKMEGERKRELENKFEVNAIYNSIKNC